MVKMLTVEERPSRADLEIQKHHVSYRGGKKHDEGKPEFDRLAYDALGEMNKVHKFGDSKYSEGNWREGLDVKRLINAGIRHAFALLNGELIDKETQTLHSANAAVNFEMVTHYLLNADKYKKYIQWPKRPKVVD